MFETLQKIRSSVVQTHRIAEPASTLLLVSAVAVLLGLVTRITFAQPAQKTLAAVVSQSAEPGGQVRVQVHGRPGQQLAAYLPGLSSDLVALQYDSDGQTYRAAVNVPQTAPSPGSCTLRIVEGGVHELDRHVELIESLARPGS